MKIQRNKFNIWGYFFIQGGFKILEKVIEMWRNYVVFWIILQGLGDNNWRIRFSISFFIFWVGNFEGYNKGEIVNQFIQGLKFELFLNYFKFRNLN